MGTLQGLARQVGAVRLRSQNGIPVIEETYGYTVLASGPGETYASLLNTPGLPIVQGTLSPFGLGICTDLSGTRDPANASLWHFVGEFSSEVEDRQGGGNPAADPNAWSPEEWVPVRETKFERLVEVALVDRSGNAVVNSAGDNFPSGITRARYIPVWEFFQFESASVTDEQVLERCEVVNDAVYKGKAAKTFLCIVLSSVVGFYYGAPRRLTQYALKYNRKTWQDRRLDIGPNFISGGERLAYTNQQGFPIFGGLDGSGSKVAVGSPPAIRSFDQFEAVDLAAFLRI
jgi:hypothetical protein